MPRPIEPMRARHRRPPDRRRQLGLRDQVGRHAGHRLLRRRRAAPAVGQRARRHRPVPRAAGPGPAAGGPPGGPRRGDRHLRRPTADPTSGCCNPGCTASSAAAAAERAASQPVVYVLFDLLVARRPRRDAGALRRPRPAAGRPRRARARRGPCTESHRGRRAPSSSPRSPPRASRGSSPSAATAATSPAADRARGASSRSGAARSSWSAAGCRARATGPRTLGALLVGYHDAASGAAPLRRAGRHRLHRARAARRSSSVLDRLARATRLPFDPTPAPGGRARLAHWVDPRPGGRGGLRRVDRRRRAAPSVLPRPAHRQGPGRGRARAHPVTPPHSASAGRGAACDAGPDARRCGASRRDHAGAPGRAASTAAWPGSRRSSLALRLGFPTPRSRTCAWPSTRRSSCCCDPRASPGEITLTFTVEAGGSTIDAALDRRTAPAVGRPGRARPGSRPSSPTPSTRSRSTSPATTSTWSSTGLASCLGTAPRPAGRVRPSAAGVAEAAVAPLAVGRRARRPPRSTTCSTCWITSWAMRSPRRDLDGPRSGRC